MRQNLNLPYFKLNFKILLENSIKFWTLIITWNWALNTCQRKNLRYWIFAVWKISNNLNFKITNNRIVQTRYFYGPCFLFNRNEVSHAKFYPRYCIKTFIIENWTQRTTLELCWKLLNLDTLSLANIEIIICLSLRCLKRAKFSLHAILGLIKLW